MQILPKEESVFLMLISAQGAPVGKMGAERYIHGINVWGRKLGNEPLKEQNMCTLRLSFDGVIHEFLTYSKKELSLTV